MIIRSAIAALLLVGSGTVHANLVNSYSVDYSFEGSVDFGGGDVRSDSVSGNEMQDGFTISGPADFQLTVENGLLEVGNVGYFSLFAQHAQPAPGSYSVFNPTTFSMSLSMTFDLSSAAIITLDFSTPMLPDWLFTSGASSVTLNGSEAASGVPIAVNSGSNTVVFTIQGTSVGEPGAQVFFGVNGEITAVPEPGSFALLAGGAAAVASSWAMRRRKIA